MIWTIAPIVATGRSVCYYISSALVDGVVTPVLSCIVNILVNPFCVLKYDEVFDFDESAGVDT